MPTARCLLSCSSANCCCLCQCHTLGCQQQIRSKHVNYSTGRTWASLELDLARPTHRGARAGICSASGDFTASESNALLSLMSFLYPTPDWFVGVHSFPLCQNGSWISFARIPLFAYDLGTFDGAGFEYSDRRSDPQAPVTRIFGLPDSVFIDKARYVALLPPATAYTLQARAVLWAACWCSILSQFSGGLASFLNDTHLCCARGPLQPPS